MNTDDIDNLANPSRPHLTIAGALLVAGDAAERAFDEIDDGRQERALGSLVRVLKGAEPVAESDTPDAWARRGFVRGATDMWMGTPMEGPSTGDALHDMAFGAGWYIGALAVSNARAEVRRDQ